MSQFYFPQDTYYGIPVLKDDSAEMSQKFMNLSNVLRQNQADSDQQRMAEMAAQRLSQYGEQGAAWGEQIRRDPRAALMMAEQYGGFGEIEAQLSAARAQGDFTRQLADMQARGASPQDIVDFYVRNGNPAAAKQVADTYGIGGEPSLKAVQTPNGPRYVRAQDAIGLEPVQSGPLVNIEGDSLDMNQIATASRAERQSFVERMAPFEMLDRAQTTMRNVRAMADQNGVLPQQASQIIASDAMAALRPEALNEGDVARLTAVGLWNKALARLGLPPQMTVDQLDTLTRMIEDKAREAAPKRRALIEDGRFRAEQFGFAPRLILGEYEGKAEEASSGPPSGFKQHPTVPGLWINEAGEGWVP